MATIPFMLTAIVVCASQLVLGLEKCDSYGFCYKASETCVNGYCQEVKRVDCGYYTCAPDKPVCCDEVIRGGCCAASSTCCGLYCCKQYTRCCNGYCRWIWEGCDKAPTTKRPTTITRPWPIWTRTAWPSSTTARPTTSKPGYSRDNKDKSNTLEIILIPTILAIVMVPILICSCICIRKHSKPRAARPPAVSRRGGTSRSSRPTQNRTVYLITTAGQARTQQARIQPPGQHPAAFNNEAYTSDLFAMHGADAYKYLPPPYPGPPQPEAPPPAYSDIASEHAYETMERTSANVTSTDDVNISEAQHNSNQGRDHLEQRIEQENVYDEIH